LVREMIDGIKNLVIGLMTTGKHLGRHAVTLQYPDEKWEMPERSRGIVVLLSDKETGKLNCTVCMLCMRACPSYAIKIDFEKDEKKKRQLVDFVVDYNRCCLCGLCEDACNFAAIKLAPGYEFSTTNKEDLIWHTDKLQEMGRDVPYEKPVKKKKPVAKPAAPKPDSPKTDTDISGDKSETKPGNITTEPPKTKADETSPEVKEPPEKSSTDEQDDTKKDSSTDSEEQK